MTTDDIMDTIKRMKAIRTLRGDYAVYQLSREIVVLLTGIEDDILVGQVAAKIIEFVDKSR
jgi:hypothetical protein